jgi:hypothetical protein
VHRQRLRGGIASVCEIGSPAIGDGQLVIGPADHRVGFAIGEDVVAKAFFVGRDRLLVAAETVIGARQNQVGVADSRRIMGFDPLN